MRFIDEHADRADGGLRWGVEPICRVLSEHGCKIAPSTYYEAVNRRNRLPSKRELRDEQVKKLVEMSGGDAPRPRRLLERY